MRRLASSLTTLAAAGFDSFPAAGQANAAARSSCRAAAAEDRP